MAQATNELSKLIRMRGSVKAKLTNFSSYFETAKGYPKLSEVHANELRLRLSRVEDLIKDFDDLQIQIECLSNPPEEQYAAREEFEGQYYQIVASARTFLESAGAGGKRDCSVSESSYSDTKPGGPCNQKSKFQLPKINIPKFDGAYQNWLEFRDTFSSLIHKNNDLDEISKFHYLRASLSGSAAIVIQNIDLMSENYTTAWELLCVRYDNSRLLVNNHVQALFNVEAIQKESSRSLRNLVDVTNKNIRALTILKQPTQHWDTLVIHMMTSKLDSITLLKWEEYRNTLSVPPTLEMFCTFLRNRSDLLESLEENTKKTKGESSKNRSFLTVSSSSDKFNKNMENYKCPMCDSSHSLYNCDKFRELSIEGRISKAKDLKVCLNCLRPGHSHIRCRFSNCRYCRYKHNTLLHIHKHDENLASSMPNQETVALSTDIQSGSDNTIDPVVLSANTIQHTTSPHVLLSTALVRVRDSKGGAHTVRLLLDNGSTANFITSELCGKLGLSKRGTSSTVSSICNQTYKTTQSCKLTIESLHSNFKTNINCLILPQIAKALPSKFVNIDNILIPSGIQLADPSFNIPAAVDILVGAEIFWNVMCNNSIDLGNNMPKVYETKLGWLVSGYVARANNQQHHCHFINQDDIISQFWELDSIPSKYVLTSEERACENKFKLDTYRNHEGRFVVTMPLKKDPHELGDSYVMAKIRFLSLERRFSRDPVFKSKYLEFLREYEELGHMTENAVSSQENCNIVNYYLPHHGVIRESSTTTKLRTVFDASAVTTTGLSLNDIQMIGPTVQDDLFSILIRFRQHKYVISGDIEKMYRAIEVNPCQRSLQQIIFRSDPSLPLKTYTLNTVTYGVASAPYLATKCLSSLSETVDDIHVKNSIKRDFYVDDYLSGGNTKEAVVKQTKAVIDVLSSAKFNLRKFKSNSQEILSQLLLDRTNSNHILDISENSNTPSKTLGLMWNTKCDTLSVSVNIENKGKVTKRHILSVISQIFDPLGLVGLAVVESKIILQQLWSLKLGWDDEVPANIKEQWTSFSEKLLFLNSIKIPRWILQDDFCKIELHIFSDASERAYGSCIYARSITKENKVYVSLIASKNKVAPMKPTTMPRLELCAALLATRLCAKVKDSLTLQVSCRYWCDSTIVLGWLNTPVHRLKPFVRNRVNEINENSVNCTWSYVPSFDNPADLVSRGVKADLISNLSVWWFGPQFLSCNEESWPKIPNSSETHDLPDVICHLTQTSNPDIKNTNIVSELIQKHSNLTRLIHTFAYVQRFIKTCKNNKCKGSLTLDELRESLFTILRQGQIEMFPEEYKILKNNGQLPSKNRLLSLTPFVDLDNLIRVGGRLDNSPYSYDQKHPILLCSKHYLTKLIFRKQHLRLLHAGPQLLLADIRQSYWVLGGRNLARYTVKKCVTCFRQKSQTVQPIMGQLPESRTKLEFPFFHCAVDYAGPILIADRKGRGCKLLKSYLCIFVCLAVKAVHLELVTDLSKDSYLAALRRFISRRGKPKTITSDNGTNFVGACNELESFLSQCNIADDLADEGIKFIFTPAYSPHFNGMAEAAVRSTKHHLRRMLNLTHLTYEEMSTCLTQVEAILNSRPLIPLSSEASDFSVLTPSHFLIGRTLTSVPYPQVAENVNITLLQRHKRVEAIKQYFWQRFTNDYICTLQQKTKWKENKNDIKINSVVLIKDKSTPPLLWSIGRVIQVYPGADGINRVAEVKTMKGTIRRGWNNLCALPLDENF